MTLRDRVLEVLGPTGPLSRRLDGWERRPQQEELAGAIAHALENAQALVGEAGTGVGKSFAYLIPALLWADEQKAQVVVSTRTKALQEQIAKKDLPFLQAVLPIEFTWAVAVGRNNYVCLRRLRNAMRGQRELFPDPKRKEQLAAIAAWADADPERGVQSELPFVPEHAVWEEVQAEQGNCLGKKCDFFEPCHWQRAKNVMKTARILVVNHALYFADLALRTQGIPYLPRHECVVFDEAHHLEAIASEALGMRFSPGQLEWQLSRLKSRNGQRGLLVRGGFVRESQLVDELRQAADSYWDLPRALIDSSGEGQRRLRRDEPIPDELSTTLERLAYALAARAEDGQLEQKLELQTRSQKLLDLAQASREFAREFDDDEVRWVERERKQSVLRAAPIHVGGLLAETLFDDITRCILVSATLGPPQDGFAWLRSRIGLEHADTIGVDSPFPYHENVELVVEEGLPDPASQATDFEREATTRIAEICVENGGRALVLCTSWRFVQRCAQALRGPCEAAGLRLLVQGDRALAQLIDEKRTIPESVLVGTDTLWEGIDIPGEAVTLVVLTRFPFPVPSHPLTAARCEDLARRGLRSFDEYSMPLALLKFKQGFGRLVRSGTDTGRVVVLDPRARRKAYGRRFLESLPRCRRSFG